MKKTLLALLLILVLPCAAQHFRLPIWPDGAIAHRVPTNEAEIRDSTDILRISKVQVPEIEVYLADTTRQTGKAVLILPGGGYRILAYHWEGTQFARWLQARGITGVVLKYRLPDSRSLTEAHLVPLSDAQRAMRLLREKATQWTIDPGKIGVMGFSAGGHLAASLSTQYEARVYEPVDRADLLSSRPDFSVLVYPVITFSASAVHSGSREALLGPSPSDSLLRFFSPELQVGPETPPAFLLHAADDTGVPVANSLAYYEAMRAAGRPATLHLVPEGGHGFAMARGDAYLSRWVEWLEAWLLNL
ncbi:alpha/beta hydrolase [Robiginitalea sediminis]|uniref:alpha/beta hydrolase n=1 Tax=Robiginitalea sediminis TaxID=1982593 RepID=UPI001303561F|nr:alpha/beta hydrolase [Robiginitalea sediminis]